MNVPLVVPPTVPCPMVNQVSLLASAWMVTLPEDSILTRFGPVTLKVMIDAAQLILPSDSLSLAIACEWCLVV